VGVQLFEVLWGPQVKKKENISAFQVDRGVATVRKDTDRSRSGLKSNKLIVVCVFFYYWKQTHSGLSR
jgi:hypothetical protein